MTKILTLALALSLTIAAGARAADNSLDTAISLYMSASYEDALAVLSALPAGTDLDQVDKYRALCLLGLNRPQEAEAAIERLVARRPLLTLDETESPKLVLMYREAQAHVIPAVAKKLYGTARSHFESGQAETATAEFRQVLAMMAQIAPSEDPALADLKLLAEGFIKLADEQASQRPSKSAAAQPQAQPPAAQSPAAQSPAAQPAAVQPVVARAAAIAAPPQVFDITDADVTPPIVVSQELPPWTARDYGQKAYVGTIEIVIDERGGVLSATIPSAINPGYDQQLLQAAKRWRYQPARRGGEAVRFRKLIGVTLAAPTGRP
jgi:periplasmic protein TonB